jgi:hypothetical protein
MITKEETSEAENDGKFTEIDIRNNFYTLKEAAFRASVSTQEFLTQGVLNVMPFFVFTDVDISQYFIVGRSLSDFVSATNPSHTLRNQLLESSTDSGKATILFLSSKDCKALLEREASHLRMPSKPLKPLKQRSFRCGWTIQIQQINEINSEGLSIPYRKEVFIQVANNIMFPEIVEPIAIFQSQLYVTHVDLKRFLFESPQASDYKFDHYFDSNVMPYFQSCRQLYELYCTAKRYWANAVPEDPETHTSQKEIREYLHNHYQFKDYLAADAAGIICPTYARKKDKNLYLMETDFITSEFKALVFAWEYFWKRQSKEIKRDYSNAQVAKHLMQFPGWNVSKDWAESGATIIRPTHATEGAKKTTQN